MTDRPPCHFGDKAHPLLPKHEHEYQPTLNMARRCTCGWRHFKVTVGAVGGVLVSCGRCGRDSYGATLYERGRMDGLPEVRTADAKAPF